LLLILILFPLIDWIAGFESKTLNFIFLFILLLIGIFLCFLLLSLLLFFICYESLIVLLFFILLLFIPSYYRIRTSFYLFLFTIFGTIALIMCLLIVVLSDWLLCSLFLVFPFYIKIPCFPFYYWLPEVHCEVNSSISLFLAGLLLKLGLFGIMRFILCSFFLVLGFLCSFVISFSVMGVIIVSCSCFPSMLILSLLSVIFLSVGNATAGAIGVGILFAFLVISICRNPSISNSLVRWTFIGSSLVEVSGFIGLVYSFLILYALFTLYLLFLLFYIWMLISLLTSREYILTSYFPLNSLFIVFFIQFQLLCYCFWFFIGVLLWFLIYYIVLLFILLFTRGFYYLV